MMIHEVKWVPSNYILYNKIRVKYEKQTKTYIYHVKKGTRNDNERSKGNRIYKHYIKINSGEEGKH